MIIDKWFSNVYVFKEMLFLYEIALNFLFSHSFINKRIYT